MTPKPRRSLLQTQVIAQLAQQPCTSVTALAKVVGASRPSVSRSLHALNDQGVVERSGRTWLLTDMGRAEADSAVSRLRDDTEDVVVLAGRKFKALSRVASSSSLASLERSLSAHHHSLSANLRALQADTLRALPVESMASLGASFDRVVESAGMQTLSSVLASSMTSADLTGLGSIAERLAEIESPVTELGWALTKTLALDVSAVASPLLNAQEQFSSLLAHIPSEELRLDYAAISNQTGLFAEALDNVVGVQHAQAALLAERAIALDAFAWVPDRLSEVVTSFADVFREAVTGLQWLGPDALVPSLAVRLTTTTAPVTHYTSAVRYLIESEIEHPELLPAPSARCKDPVGNERLDERLHRLNPDFPDMRQGAWQALEGNNSDKLRHAATSQRDLLTQLLRFVAPEIDLGEDDEPGSKIKARVKVVLGGSESEAEFVKTVANAVYAHYSMLSKYNHTNQKHEDSLRAILNTGEGLIEFLLVNVDFDLDS